MIAAIHSRLKKMNITIYMIKLINPRGTSVERKNVRAYVSMVLTFDNCNPGQSTYIVMVVCNHKMTALMHHFVKSLLDLLNYRLITKICDCAKMLKWA